ncbi:integrin alpha [Myxococcota bacterium]|nr:integrin alpha [Myxococcota bacterium]
MAISAPGWDQRGSDLGAAGIFFGPLSGDWAFSDADVLVAGHRPGDAAGAAISPHPGDLDGDGFADLVVGAPRSDLGGADSGAVYVVGGGAALVADLDGDGWISPGADCDDGDATVYPGAEERLDGRDGDCDGGIDEIDLGHSDAVVVGAEGDSLGCIMAVVGDTDGDGVGELLIGSPYSGLGGDHAGAAYLFGGPPSGALGPGDARATIIGDSMYASLGTAVAGAGDVNGFGLTDRCPRGTGGAPGATDRRTNAEGRGWPRRRPGVRAVGQRRGLV